MDRAKRTFQLELFREFFDGIIRSAPESIALLVLIEVFLKPSQLSGEWAQSVIFSSTFFGMFSSVFLVSFLRRFEKKSTHWIIVFSLISGSISILSIFSEGYVSYTLCVAFTFFFIPLKLPYLTEIYHQNFPSDVRGKYHGWSLMVAQVATVGFCYIAGEWLKLDLESWKLIFVVVGLSSFLSCIFVYLMPAKKAEKKKKTHILSAFRWVWKDGLFGYILLVWFLFGFANLWIFPIRVHYLSIDKNWDPSTVAILVAVVPETVRFLFLPIWAWFFDRYNFILLRILLNVFLAIGIYGFFHWDSVIGIAIASGLHGIGFAGGRLTWGLWVTKMVPSYKSAEYMSVHIALTGLRGLVGPALGFWVLSQLQGGGYQKPYTFLSEISVCIFVLSILMLIPVIQQGKRETD